MNFKVKFDDAAMKRVVEKIEEVSMPMDSQTAKKIGDEVVDAMKASIETGSSTIMGRGKFEAYRGTYRKRIQKYGYVHTEDGKFSKRLRPVNLKVSGKFLDSLKATVQRVKGGYASVIGFSDKKSQKKEQGHREGANEQAERPIIPQSGEKFTQRIQEIYLSLINERIARVIKRK